MLWEKKKKKKKVMDMKVIGNEARVVLDELR